MVQRRTVLRHLAGGIAGTVVVSNAPVAAETPTEPSGQSSAQGQSAPTPVPRLLDDHQRQTLASLAEMLVPGSVAAGAVDLIDRVLIVESMPRQRSFLNALGAFEREARDTHGARWIDLDDATRITVLQRAATAPESRPLPPPWTKGAPVVMADDEPAPPATLRDHFTRLRNAVANAYFATEPGMRELGWLGRTSWTELPACTHPDPAHE